MLFFRAAHALRAARSKMDPADMKNRLRANFHRFLGLGLLMFTPAWAPAQAGGTLSSPGAEAVAPADAWRFRVYLDDREIGYHNFYLQQSGDMRLLHSEANFEYRLMFVKLFHYEHENRETWNGDCLSSIESRTDSNGEPYRVDGQLETGHFRVDGSAGQATLPECVMSFAYWNPAFLEQGRLLNTQNGEYLDVDISAPVAESLTVRGEQQPSYRYRLEAGELRLDLWYSANDEWLALESEVRGGRKLRYELL
jgi:hypothetical protein